MPKLNCEIRNCVYNADFLCARSVIKVVDEEARTSKETSCSSFHKRKKQLSDRDIYLTEFASFDGVNQYVSIDCESVNCKYNENLICTAENIKIAGNSKARKRNETICETFINKQ